MKTINQSFGAVIAGLALTTLFAAVSIVAKSAAPQGADRSGPWRGLPHRHGPLGKRWVHRDGHPVPAQAVQRSVRPKQYGPPSIKARSWVRDGTAGAMCCGSLPARTSAADSND